MEITIHRGGSQIGGCITEIASGKARILIDLGQNLPNGEGQSIDELANSTSVGQLTQGVDAIFYTHYHGDHYGLFHLVPDSIPQFIGSVAKKVAICKHQRLGFIKGRKETSAREVALLESMQTFVPRQIIEVKDIRIIPYFVSHSACDAYMFLIEANGTRILHTGDFRGHGYLSKGLLPTIEKLILKKGKIDFLITERTMLSRVGENVLREFELKQKAIDLMKQYKYCFVMCSSTDMERLASFHAANKTFKNRPFVCDDFQNSILTIFSESAGKESSLFNFVHPCTFDAKDAKLLNRMHDDGFCMMVRATDKFEGFGALLKPQLVMDQTVLIYSMWKEYINPNGKHANKRYLDFVGQFPNVVHLHTSGHATPICLAEVCNLVNPTMGIIPIHKEQTSDFSSLPISDELIPKIITESTTLNDVTVRIH
jgi:ribonuclease J